MEENPILDFLEHADYPFESNSMEYTTTIEDIHTKILKKQDVILYGPPGTGKTFLVDSVVDLLGDEKGEVGKVQFHSEYTYDDFIEGLFPIEQGGFKYVEGVFLSFCNKVKNDLDKEKIHVFIIDEINRANITSVFGEVMYLIENKGARELTTARTKTLFSIPENIVIIATMNTADKSLSKLDFALRRRFRFLPVYPDYKILKELILKIGFDDELKSIISEVKYANAFSKLNNKIRVHSLLGKELTLGHILWIPKISGEGPLTREDIGETFRELIFPQLQSYCGANTEILSGLIGPELKDDLLLGRYIKDESILALLLSLQNNKSGESYDN